MNDAPRQTLRELIIQYGHSLCDDPRRCEALLKDYCGQYKREIFVLISALKAKIACELINFHNNIPEVILLSRLANRLIEDFALTEDAAKWAVESWRIALSHTPYEPNHKDLQHHIFSAKQGNISAQARLGWIYQNSKGVDQDYQEGIKWFRLAAEQGDAYSQNWLGWIYEHGQGVDQNYQEAVKWYQLAAEQGYALAEYKLGIMYGQGLGVPHDDEKTIKWLRLAAEHGCADAQNMIGCIYSEIYKNKKEAVKWFLLAAEQGNNIAQLNLGSAYLRGDGVSINYHEAMRWHRLSAENGNSMAQEFLGLVYFLGKISVNDYNPMDNIIHQDYQEAFKWFQLAAENNSAYSQFFIGRMYENGLGLAQNFQEAIKWYQLAANHGYNDAQQAIKNILLKIKCEN